MKLFALLAMACAGAAGCAPDSAPPSAAAPVAGAVAEVSGTAPAGAVVSLSPASAEAAMPDGPAVLDQYAKQFVPPVLYVRVGQPVEFRNTDNLGHNVNVHRRGTGAAIFDVETDPQQKYVHTFDRVGQYDVACSEHAGMQATLVATDSALAAITYRLRATFEGRTVEQAVDVKGSRTDVRVVP
jgi:plastocyanin